MNSRLFAGNITEHTLCPLVLALMALLLSVAFCDAQPRAPITTIKEVSQLSAAEADQRHTVQLEAVVTYVDPDAMVLFVQDKTGGVFIDVGTAMPGCKAGDEVALRGHTESGRFNPIVALLSLQVKGSGRLPDAVEVSIGQIWTGNYDGRRVKLRGHVRHHVVEGDITMLELAEAEREIITRIRNFPPAALADLNFAEVEVTGPTSVSRNEGRKVTGVDLWVPTGEHVTIFRTGKQVAQAMELASPTLFATNNAINAETQPVRIRGTVLHASERFGIKVQCGDTPLAVHAYRKLLPPVGTEIEAMGWPRRQRGANQLVGAHVSILGPGKLPVPQTISLAQARQRVGRENLVTMEGILRHRVVRDEENDWIVEQGQGYFEASLPAGVDDLENPVATAGTSVRLTGVLNNDGPATDPAPRVRLLLRSRNDISVTSSPPWPTGRVLKILSVTLALHVVGLAAMLVIYRRLRRRTADLTEARIALEGANRDLEGRVQARTATLTAANKALRESEERFRQLATNIDEIFWMSTPDNKEVLYLSPSFEKICGRSADDIYKAPDQWFQLVHPDDREEVFRVALRQPVLAGYELEYRIIRPDGGIRWLNDRAFPIRDENGVTFRVAGIAADITERKQAEEELREQNLALSNAMPGISRLTPDGYYTYANVHYAQLQGCEPKDLIGTHFSETVHPEDMLAATKAFELMVAEGKAEVEIRGVRRDGSVFWKHAMLIRIARSCDRMTGYHCFIRDITNRKRSEMLLEGQKAVLETIADGAPLRETLDTLARFVESQSERSHVSILVTREDGRHLGNGAAPSMPEALLPLTESLPIAADAGSCGACAHLRQRVVVPDLATEPLFAKVTEQYLAHNLRACVSAPVLGSSGDVFGTVCLFFEVPRTPTPEEDHLLHLATQMAAIAIERDLTRNAERLAQERYRGIVDNATDAVITFDDQQRIEVFNQAAEAMFGCPARDAVGRSFADFIPASHHVVQREDLRNDADTRRLGASNPLTGRRGNGEEFPIEASLSQSVVRGRTLTTAILRDLTDKQRAERTHLQLESRLRQAHKMEAIGTLAGGIAHDFNNILGAVMLNIELARGEIPSSHPAQEYLAALRGSSLRARDLVRQILAFSRQQEQQRNILRLERLVEEALKLIRAALPSTIEINVRLTSDGPSILADSTQVHQVLTNLSANAAHAMRDCGGRLDLQQTTVDVDAALAASSPDLQPGRYVELAITDTGIGMPPEILERIFDPFFTTKGPGEGTGLGLAVVHGIMKDHDGAVVVESAPGKGTTFRLYFPAVEEPETPVPEDRQPLARGQGERILIVDDEAPLLRVNQRTLERLGYTVTSCATASAALNLFRSNPGNFDAVITDFAMPGMTGLELSRELLRLRPGCPIILTTGYTTTLDPENIKALGLAGLLFKPTTTAAIGEAVHDALQSGKSA